MSNYRKTMADALREMYPLTEETQIDEATMSSSQIARLKKAYEPMRDKKISTSNADKLSAMMDKVGKDKEALIQLFKADIPFVSQSAVTKLITKHNMKGAEINKLREEVELDEGKLGDQWQKGAKSVKSGSFELIRGKSGVHNIMKSGKKIGTFSYDDEGDNFVANMKGERGQLVGNDIDTLISNFKEEVDLDKLPDMGDALRQVRAEEVDLKEAKYELYHKDFSSAMQHAYKSAKKLYGITIDPEEIDSKVATGPSKPSEGKTNSYRLKGDKGGIQVQVYNKGGSKPFELNMYKEEVDLDEDSLGDFQDFARLYGGGDEIYVVTQGKDSNSLKVIGIEKDPNKAKKIRDRAKGARASLWGQMKSSQKVLKLKIGDPVSFEDSKNKLSFIEELDLDEAIKVGDNVKVKLSRKGREYIEKGKVIEIEKDSIIVKHDFSRTPSKVKMTDIVKEEADLDEGKMSQLHQHIKDKKSAEEIAKLMKVDVKTIKALMSSHHPEDVEEGAAADARRAMSKDKDLRRSKDSADDDNSATDDDVKAASKNIMMQLRKAQSLGGAGGDPKRRFKVEFGDGKKVEIPVKMAQAITKKFDAQRKPADKEKFQAKIGKSYRDMLSALKEELQPQKESILERMNRKIKENKDG
jgi:hypothetical protein